MFLPIRSVDKYPVNPGQFTGFSLFVGVTAMEDLGINVRTVTHTHNPHSVIYLGMHQCVSVDPAYTLALSERIAAGIVVKRLLAGDRGHWSPFELATIVFNCANIPHSAVAQMTRHRVAVSFSIQSFRYTAPARGTPIEQVVYLRPVGQYPDREGRKKDYTQAHRDRDLEIAQQLFDHFCDRIDEGFAPEQARGLMPFDLRQHVNVGFNARSLMHFLDLRHKADAQLEVRILAELMFQRFKEWMPETAEYYENKRLNRAKLAP